jgi:hypothetical protein
MGRRETNGKDKNEIPQRSDEAIQANGYREGQTKQGVQESYSHEEKRQTKDGAAAGHSVEQR